MIFVDTNIIIDLLEPDPRWAGWSGERLAKAAQRDIVAASAVVAAECAARFPTLAHLRATFDEMDIGIEGIPLDAMFVAGQALRRYRRDGANREKILSDFLIGAHAAHGGSALITRDPRLYRRYFSDLTLITPETDA